MIARIAAVLPSQLKYATASLRPLYTNLLRLGGSIKAVQLPHGTLRWHVDQLTSQQHLLGTYEPYLQQAMRDWVRPGDVVYDIGSHAGFHALSAALLVGPRGNVVAFEPYPENYRSLERQLAANPNLPVLALRIAASDREAVVVMERPAASAQSFISTAGDVSVRARPIDAMVADRTVPPPALIKVDVEGHEAAVLHGARSTIAAYLPIILCDYNDADTKQVVQAAVADLAYEVRPGPPVIAIPRGRIL